MALREVSDERRVAELEDEVDTLRERIRQLEADLGHRPRKMPTAFGLTRAETHVLSVLHARVEPVSRDRLLDATCGGRPADADLPEPKVFDIHILRIRRKVRPWGVMIRTHFGVGWELTPGSRALIDELLADEAAERGRRSDERG